MDFCTCCFAIVVATVDLQLLFAVVEQCLATGEMVYAEEIFNRLKTLVRGWKFERTLLEDDRMWGQFALQSGCKWAVWLYQSGRVKEGIEVLEPIFHMYHREGWWHRTAHCANSLGEMYNRLNQPDRGLSLLEVARKIFDRLGLVAEMNTLEKIGMVHQRQGRYEEAKNFFQQALESGKRHNCFVGSIYCRHHRTQHELDISLFIYGWFEYLQLISCFFTVQQRLGKRRAMIGKHAFLPYHHYTSSPAFATQAGSQLSTSMTGTDDYAGLVCIHNYSFHCLR